MKKQPYIYFLDRSKKENLINSTHEKVCTKCGKPKKLREFHFKFERGAWYTLSRCRLCFGRIRNAKRKEGKWSEKKLQSKYRRDKVRAKRDVEQLTDYYVARTIVRKKVSTILNNKDLLKAKRAVIMLKRAIKNAPRL